MNKYEIMFIVKATEDAENVKKTADTFKSLVETLKGSVEKMDEMGSRKLAYPIKKEVSGYYYVLTCNLSIEAVKEFDRKIKLDENVLRHLIIRKDGE
jgi:small subunit ribosomal protein S6